MGFFSRHRKAFRSVIASFGMLFGLLAGVSVTANVGYAGVSGSLDSPLSEYLGLTVKDGPTADSTWAYSGRTITGSLSGALFWGTKCTLSIKNNKQLADISFDWNVTIGGGSATIDGKVYSATQNGSFTKQNFEVGKTIEVVLDASRGKEVSVRLTNIQMILIQQREITFKPSTNGFFTVDGKRIDETFSTGMETSSVSHLLSATPNEGYIFFGWEKDGAVVSIDSNFEFKSEESCVVTPVFLAIGDSAEGAYLVDDVYFYRFETAISAASQNGSSGVVTITKNGSVPKKPDGTSYKIPAGVTFVVPNSSNCIANLYCSAIPPTVLTGVFNTTPFVTWTLQKDAKINVEGGASICVAGDLCAAGGGNLSAMPTGSLGEVVLEEGSEIIFNSASKLYCYGYITGGGCITAKSGSEVHEFFQFYWRGGQSALSWQTNLTTKAFLFSQYHIQNIECLFRVYEGATEILSFAFVMNGSINQTSFEFIGSNGLFILGNSAAYLERKYMASEGRIHYWLYGDASLSHIAISMLGQTVDSKKSHMPIMNNFDLEICSGETKILNDYALLPGSSIMIHEGAMLTIQSSAKVFLFDSRDWKDKGFAGAGKDYVSTPNLSSWLRKKGYSPVTISDFKGATIDVNGTVTVSGQLLRTNSNDPEDISTSDHTAVGKIISSNQCGKVIYANGYAYDSKSNQNTDQLTQSGNSIKSHSLTSAAVLFENDSESYFVGSVDKGGRVIYKYDSAAGRRKWMGDKAGTGIITITFVWQGGTTTKEFEGGDVNLPVSIGSSGDVVLWYEAENPENFYEPGIVQPSIISSITVTAFYGGWYKAGSAVNSDRYYFDAKIGMVKGLYKAENEDSTEYNVYLFDKDGVFQSGLTGVFYYDASIYSSGDNQYYYLDNGVVLSDVRWKVKITGSTADGGSTRNDYYYFGNGNTASKSQTIELNSSQTNSVFPDGYFTFGSEGRLESFIANGTFDWGSKNIVLQNEVCYYESVRAGIGLFTSGTHIYYAKDDGSIMKNGTYYVEEGKLNGKATKAGLYYFDTNGYLCDSMMNPITVTPSEASA